MSPALHHSLTLGAWQALTWLTQPLLRRKLARRARTEAGYGVAVAERFGHYTSPPAPADGHPCIWIHAVSLGETRAAALLLAALRQRLPTLRLLLTHSTATGREAGQPLLRPGDQHTWLPWDQAGAVRRFLDHFQPTMGLLMETEVWPQLAHSCHARQIPLLLVNARLSERSFLKAQRLGWLSHPAHQALAGVWAQTVADAQRLRALGAPVRRITGNLKFDATPDAQQLARAQAWRRQRSVQRPVVLLASSREGEEDLFLDALPRLGHPGAASPASQQLASAAHWLIVPRHPQRFAAVAARIESRGWRVLRRSDWPQGLPPQHSDSRPTIWLGDSLGEMALYVGLADVALLGGSFAPLGGQNLIELAACGCPVLMGPHTFNFAEAAEQALAAGAARRVATLDQALSTAADWLFDQPQALAQAAAAGRDFAQAHRGATAQTADDVLELLANRPQPSPSTHARRWPGAGLRDQVT